MCAAGLDPTFSALPHRRLGDVALARAQELGASHADFRFERVRYQYLGARDGVLQTASDTEDLGFSVRVVHGGAWGFAAAGLLMALMAALAAQALDQPAPATWIVGDAPPVVTEENPWCSTLNGRTICVGEPD